MSQTIKNNKSSNPGHIKSIALDEQALAEVNAIHNIRSADGVGAFSQKSKPKQNSHAEAKSLFVLRRSRWVDPSVSPFHP